MLYGYTCIDIREGKREVAKQVKAIKEYAKEVYQTPEIIHDVVDIQQWVHPENCKNGLQFIIDNVKPGDIVIFPTLESIFPTNTGRVGVLAQLYYLNAKIAVVDFPMIEKIQFNPLIANRQDSFDWYSTRIESVLECRDYMLNA